MEYTLSLNEQDFSVLSAALVEMPFKLAAPLIQKINLQIAEREKAEQEKLAGAQQKKTE